MKDWHFNVLFFVGVGSALFLLIAPVFDLAIDPVALTGVGTILTYVLTQRNKFTSQSDQDKDTDGGEVKR